MKFEEAMSKLENIMTKMNDKDTSLEEGIKLYEQGAKLSQECLMILEESKGKIAILTKKLNKLEEGEFDVDGDNND